MPFLSWQLKFWPILSYQLTPCRPSIRGCWRELAIRCCFCYFLLRLFLVFFPSITDRRTAYARWLDDSSVAWVFKERGSNITEWLGGSDGSPVSGVFKERGRYITEWFGGSMACQSLWLASHLASSTNTLGKLAMYSVVMPQSLPISTDSIISSYVPHMTASHLFRARAIVFVSLLIFGFM